LQNKLAQAIFRHNNKPRLQALSACMTRLRDGMADIKITTEVAGRICALPLSEGSTINNGDEIAFVEAMKMEIPVPSTASGTLKSLLVKIDDVVAEDQVVAIVEA
jgi:biotin carboxyl carrier protein